MTTFTLLTKICWFLFVVVWVIFSVNAKKNIQSNFDRQGWFIRLAIIVVLMLVLKIKPLRHLADTYFFSSNQFVQGCGVFICAVGIAFAIWARIHIGKNWGMPMSQKEKPELVTTGPYRFVRHPIYTGVCIAMIGSVITEGFMWLIWFALLGGYFIYSAKKEEKSLLLQFPDKYPEYMRRTKMLIPFIF
jgi:protein-S-isoprenylcysteine O-methyltransferase Ste14